jgi:hypothetical protein
MKAKPIISYQCECGWVLGWTPQRKSLTCTNVKCVHFHVEFAAPVEVLRKIGPLSSEDSAGL